MGAPSVNLKGIGDKSIKKVEIPNIIVSQHTPLIMIMTKQGPTDVMVIPIEFFDVIYDLDSLQVNSPWHSHQSELVRIAIEEANSTIAIKRIVDKDSKTAGAVIGVSPDDNRIQVRGLDTLEKDFDYSEFLPFFSFKTHNPGTWGNYIGLEIYLADDRYQNTIGKDIGAVVYEAMVIQEDQMTGLRSVVPNLIGEATTRFTLKPDGMSKNINYYFDSIMKQMYIEEYPQIKRMPMFDSFKVHLDEIQALVDDEEFWKYNILKDVATNNGVGFAKGLTIFAQGGHDGFIPTTTSKVQASLEKCRKYEEAVKLWLDTIDETNPICDMNKYPFSTIWDTGFTHETKMGFLNIFRNRTDVWVAIATTSLNRYTTVGSDRVFDYSPKLSTQELISLSTYYRSVFGGLVESQFFGTPVVRSTLVMQDGINRNSVYKKRQTINVDLFAKVCRYCGGASQKWSSQNAFDDDKTNYLLGWQDVSVPYMPPGIKDIAWDAGVIYVQNKDVKHLFYPMFQTLYPDDTSILNNIFVMMACCWIQKIHQKAWVMISGNGKLTDAEIAEKIDNYINTEVQGLFDGRFIIQANTYYTVTDKTNGYSFTTDTEIYSTMAKYKANYKITAHRMSDFK